MTILWNLILFSLWFLVLLVASVRTRCSAPSSWKNGYLTFGSFNRLSKINRMVMSLWARLLLTLPESKLILKDKWLSDACVKNRVYDTFHSYGITKQRLILVSSVKTHKEHLDLYNRVYIVLDTYPVNGQTTSCESLWMGGPMVTLAGNRCSQRFGYSLLSRLGLSKT